MSGKRMKWHFFLHHLRDAYFFIIGKKYTHILFHAPVYFHYLHIEPLILSMRSNKNIRISVVKWDTYDETRNIQGVNFISKENIRESIFGVYDCYFTTEYLKEFWWFGKDVKKVYLLHGVGPKSSYIKNDGLKEYDCVFSPGPEVRKMQAEVVNKNKIYNTGLPVTDTLVHKANEEKAWFDFKDNSKPVLLYAPSWSNSQDMVSIDDEILRSLKSQRICNVIIKPHPLLLQPSRCEGKNWLAKFNQVEGDNLIVCKEIDTSIYGILKGSDMVLGDISSVLYEFMVLDRPTLVYADERIFHYYGSRSEYDSLMPAVHKVKSAHDLEEALMFIVKQVDNKSVERQWLLEKTFYNLGTSVDATLSQLYQILDVEEYI